MIRLGIGLRLVLAIWLALPVAHGVSTLLLTTSFLVEFLGHGGWRPLSALTRDPAVRSLPAGERCVPTLLRTKTTRAQKGRAPVMEVD